MLGLGDAEEPDVSRNLLSLAEVLLMSVIDKWKVNMWLIRQCTCSGFPLV